MTRLSENNIYLSKLLIRAVLYSVALFLIGFFLTNLSWLKITNPTGIDYIIILKHVGTVLIPLSFILFSYLIISSTRKAYEKYYQYKDNITAKKVITLIRNGLSIIFILVAINTIISALQLTHEYFALAYDFVMVIIVGTIAWILLQILAIAEYIVYKKYKSLSLGPEKTQIISSYTKIHIVRNIASVFIIIIAIASALMVFDKVRNIGVSILASVGFVTAVFALAAQKTLSSVFIGLQLVLTEPIKIGDLVVIENESGIIEEISLTYVVIKIWDSRRLILPINYFIEKPFQNWSRDVDGLLGIVTLYVSYKLPIEAIRKELTTILEDIPLWDRRVSSISVNEFKEKCVELRAIVSAANPGNLNTLQNEVRERLLAFIRKHHPECLPDFTSSK